MSKRILISNEKRIALAKRLGIDQDYQHEIICDRHPRIMIIKSASIGISYAVSFKKLLDAFELKKQYIFVSIRKENVLNLINYMHNFHYEISQEIEGIPRKKTDSKNEIMLSNGSQLISLPAEPDAMRTWHGDVVLDEVDFAFDQKKLMTTAKGRAKPPPAQIIILSTCNESGSYVERLYEKEMKKEEKDRKWKIYTLPYTRCTIPRFREEIDEEKIEAIEDDSLDEWEREYTCKWANKKEKLYTWELIGAVVDEQKRSVIDGFKPKFAGIDFGAKVDETVIRLVGDDGEGNIKVLRGQSMSGESYTTQLENIKGIIKSNPSLQKVYIDKTAIGIRLEEELLESDVGWAIDGIHFSPERKERMAMFLHSLMTGDKIRIPQDEKLQTQIHGIKRSKTLGGHIRYRHEAGQHDDEFWALCLALIGYMDDDSVGDYKIITSGNSPRFKKEKKRRGKYTLGGHSLWD